VGFEQAARHDSDEKEGREEREAVQVVVSDTAVLEGLLGEVRKFKVIAGEHLSARRSFCRKSFEADLSYAPDVFLDSRQAFSSESSPSDSYLVRVFISSISLVSERSTDGHFTFRLGFYQVRTSPARRAPLLPLLSRSRKPSQPHVTSDSNLPSSSSDPELASYANDEFRREFISAETFRRVSSWTSSKQVNIRVCTFNVNDSLPPPIHAPEPTPVDPSPEPYNPLESLLLGTSASSNSATSNGTAYSTPAKHRSSTQASISTPIHDAHAQSPHHTKEHDAFRQSPPSAPDIICIGFQELDLSYASLFISPARTAPWISPSTGEAKVNLTKAELWVEAILHALNSSSEKGGRKTEGEGDGKRDGDEGWEVLGEELYVGVFVVVLARKGMKERGEVGGVGKAAVPCGALGGLMVSDSSIRLRYRVSMLTSALCFPRGTKPALPSV
jgi:hypothetical protein